MILNASNIGVYALTTRQNWRMEVAPDYTFRLLDTRSPQPGSRLQSIRQQFVARSALALALSRRFGLIQDQASNEGSIGQTEPLEQRDPQLAEQAARVPRSTVLGLKKAYGRSPSSYTLCRTGTKYRSGHWH